MPRHRPRRRHRPARPSRTRSTTRPCTTTRQPSSPRPCASPSRSSTPSKARRRPRSSSTPRRSGATTSPPRRPRTHAAALMDQWGVGRRDVNDGLVILFDLDTSLKHGQVQLYAGSGFDEAYISTDERQAIFEDDMLPLLRAGDLDAALGVGLSKVVTATLDPSSATGRQAHGGRCRARATVPRARGRPRRLRLRRDPVAGRDRRRRARDRRHRGADRRRGRGLHPGQRRVPDDRGDRGEGAGPDGPVGRRAQGLRRRPRHLLRHAAEPRARPGPAVRGSRLRGGLPDEPASASRSSRTT